MKMVSSHYDPVTGVSKVILRKGDELFVGECTLAEEDQHVASAYAGCQFAEVKAKIKHLRQKFQMADKELKYLENLYEQMTQLRDFETFKHSQPMQFLRKKIRLQSQEVMIRYMDYIDMKNGYPDMVDNRLKVAQEIPDLIAQSERLKGIIELSDPVE